ncbi:MAG: TolC family protein [Fidelibacterota bacterium]
MKITLLLSCIVGLLTAQEPLALTLQDALTLARENNIALKQARTSYEKATAQAREAKATAWPVISTFAQGTKNLSIASQPLSFPIPFGQLDGNGNPVPLPNDPFHQMTDLFFVDVDIPFGNDNNIIYGFSLTQPLFDGRVLAAVRSAGTYRIVAESALAAAENTMIEQTTVQYYTALVTSHVLDVMKESLELAKKHLQDTRALYQSGKVAELSVIQAEVRVANAETQVSQTRKTVELTQAMLKRTCGIDFDQSLILTEPLNPVIIDLPAYQDLVKALKANQPVLKQLEASQKLMKENILLKKAEFMPSLALTGSYSQQLPYNDGEYDPGDFRKSSSIGLGITIPLFNGFGSKARLDQAKADYTNASYSYKDTESALILELSQLYYSAREAATRISAMQKQVSQARRGVEIAQSLFQKGMATNLEYQDATNGLRQAELGLSQAYLEYHTAIAGLRRAIGKTLF